MRTALLGAVRSTEVALEALAQAGQAPKALLTLPPSLAGRHSDYVDLRVLADASGVPVHQVRSAKSQEALDLLGTVDLDLLLVVGWSEILPESVLEAARVGCLGYHPAPLPAMRGRAVIPWTVLNERSSTAGTLFWIAPGLDDGDIAFQTPFALHPRESATSLYEKHMTALRDMLERFCAVRHADEIPRRPQVEANASYCAQRKPADGLIDWSQPAYSIDRLIRATTRPYPGARSLRERDHQEVVIWEATPVRRLVDAVPGQVVAVEGGHAVVACGDGYLRIEDATAPDWERSELRVQDRLAPYPAAVAWWMWHRH
jgi:methionyl-tRNA formyltransferase